MSLPDPQPWAVSAVTLDGSPVVWLELDDLGALVVFTERSVYSFHTPRQVELFEAYCRLKGTMGR